MNRNQLSGTLYPVGVIAVVAGLAHGAMAIDVTCDVRLWDVLPRGNPTNSWDFLPCGDPIPSTGQGHDGIRLQRRLSGTSTYFDLDWFRGYPHPGSYRWDFVQNAPWLTPDVQARSNKVDILAIADFAIQQESVIRVRLEGPGGAMRLRGSTVTLEGGLNDWAARIYLGASNWDDPIWTGAHGSEFNLVIPYEQNDEIFLDMRASGYNANWSMWRNVIFGPVDQNPADVDCDGAVGLNDVLTVLSSWGPCDCTDDCPADIDGSGTVDFADMVLLLASWGS